MSSTWLSALLRRRLVTTHKLIQVRVERVPVPYNPPLPETDTRRKLAALNRPFQCAARYAEIGGSLVC